MVGKLDSHVAESSTSCSSTIEDIEDLTLPDFQQHSIRFNSEQVVKRSSKLAPLDSLHPETESFVPGE